MRLVRGDNPTPLIDELLDGAIALARADRGSVITTDMEQSWTIRSARNYPKAGISKAQARFSKTIVRAVLDAGKGCAVVRPFEDPRFFKSESVLELKSKSVLCVPLGAVRGALTLFEWERPSSFSDDDVALVAGVARLLGQALELVDRNSLLERQLGEARALAGSVTPRIVGSSAAMERVRAAIHRVSPQSFPVLVLGESGTGKEGVARTIHETGPLKQMPFVPLNMAAIPEALLESELFGHVRGAFTGATTDRKGAFREADGGTLFLDEIGEMARPLQAKVLRVLEDGWVQPLGSDKGHRVVVRLIAATNADVETRARKGAFRQDLLFRLNTVTIRLPALRERRADIRELVEHFVRALAKTKDAPVRRVSAEALEVLESHRWRGNVRELLSVVERAHSFESDTILPEHLGLRKTRHLKKLDLLRETAEREGAISALTRANWDVVRAAKLAGVSRPTMYRLIQRLGLERPL